MMAQQAHFEANSRSLTLDAVPRHHEYDDELIGVLGG